LERFNVRHREHRIGGRARHAGWQHPSRACRMEPPILCILATTPGRNTASEVLLAAPAGSICLPACRVKAPILCTAPRASSPIGSRAPAAHSSAQGKGERMLRPRVWPDVHRRSARRHDVSRTEGMGAFTVADRRSARRWLTDLAPARRVRAPRCVPRRQDSGGPWRLDRVRERREAPWALGRGAR